MMDYWQCLNTFIDVVELENFSKAAEKRYKTASAVSKQISWLEDKLHTQLFKRSTRQLFLTESGAELYQFARKFTNAFEELKESFSSSEKEVRGSLSITAPLNFGSYYVMPWIYEFMKKFPLVQVKTHVDNQFLDLLANDIDLAIRTTPTFDINYQSEVIYQEQRCTIATKEYLKAHGEPKVPDDLVNHNCVTCTGLKGQRAWTFKDDVKVPVSGTYQSNLTASLLQAVRCGVGIAHVPIDYVKKELASGEFIEILGDYRPDPEPLYLCYIRKKPVPERVLRCCQFFRDKFQLLVGAS